MVVGDEPKYYPSIVTQIVKIITERKIFKKIICFGVISITLELLLIVQLPMQLNTIF